jgi:hypothetical protein
MQVRARVCVSQRVLNLILKTGDVMKINRNRFIKMTAAVALCLVARGGTMVQAADKEDGVQSACSQLPSHDALRKALVAAQMQMNGGFGLNMWGTVVNGMASCARLRLPVASEAISGRAAG